MNGNKQFMEFIREQVMASPLGKEAYKLSNQGDWNGLLALYEREKSGWEAPTPPVVCKKGCSLCCSLNVDIMDYEKDSLRKAIDGLDEMVRQNVYFRAGAKNKITRELDDEKRSRRRKVCPLLQDHECLIYEDRPLSCKAFHSVDLEICKEGALEDSDVDSKEWAQPAHHKQMVELAYGLFQLEQGLKVDQLSTTIEKFIDEELNL